MARRGETSKSLRIRDSRSSSFSAEGESCFVADEWVGVMEEHISEGFDRILPSDFGKDADGVDSQDQAGLCLEHLDEVSLVLLLVGILHLFHHLHAVRLVLDYPSS